ncbi:MAG: histidine phosphatase family protein [Micrococcales bacterium]
MPNTVIGLLRHGQTDWNIDFRLQGTTDIPLNDTGLQQARDVGRLINSSDWDVLVSSPLSRALSTAAIVAEESGISGYQVEPLLLERSFGEAEGLTHQEWKERYADLSILPGGESLAELADRAWLLLETLAQNYSGKRVLTVSHGALIRKIVKLVSGGELPREGERFGNASLSVIAFDGSEWKVARFDPATYQGQPLNI